MYRTPTAIAAFTDFFVFVWKTATAAFTDFFVFVCVENMHMLVCVNAVSTRCFNTAVRGDVGEWHDSALQALGADLLPLAQPALPAAVRRLVLALVAAHGKVVGASGGLPALEKGVPGLDMVR